MRVSLSSLALALSPRVLSARWISSGQPFVAVVDPRAIVLIFSAALLFEFCPLHPRARRSAGMVVEVGQTPTASSPPWTPTTPVIEDKCVDLEGGEVQ
eukprot:3386042-Pyramimonas_sp.AAC.1